MFAADGRAWRSKAATRRHGACAGFMSRRLGATASIRLPKVWLRKARLVYPSQMLTHRHAIARLAGAFLASVLWSGAAAAQIAAADPEESDFGDRTLYKTVTYQSLSSLNDFLFGMVFAGGMATGGALAAVSFVTEPIFYYYHEKLWERSSNDEDPADENIGIAKTASYVTINAGRIFSTGMLLTGSPVTAAGFVAFNVVGDSVNYVANDLAWSHFWPLSPVDAGAQVEADSFERMPIR